MSIMADEMSAKSIPKKGIAERSIAEVLFPLTRALVLRELVRKDPAGDYTQAIARSTGLDPRGVHRELRRLASAGIVSSRKVGKQIFYSLNPRCPVYPDLKGLIIKTVGLADVLREALEPLVECLGVVFIYGSFARG